MSVKKIHILGICGTFMGSLALLAREFGGFKFQAVMKIFTPNVKPSPRTKYQSKSRL
ncbi:MAG: hypothetical protein Ct9H300mP3_00500 [Gammaproteobacteria bacterium]|nr:MAG: hypothetical protein Ct9H300mP3_00500 [Gammaproteobacteria bacterium]